MKRLITILLCLALGFPLTAAAEAFSMEGWLGNARLDAHETAEQLYQAALLEAPLTIYSVSTRVTDVAASFEKQYPGLNVRVEDARALVLFDMLERNHAAQDYVCDLLLCMDGGGILSDNFIPRGIVYKYTPWDLADSMVPFGDDGIQYLAGEVVQLAYNDSLNDALPVESWWELTEPQWFGRVYCPLPLRSESTFSFFQTIVQHEDKLEEAYVARYGEPVPDALGEGAGKYWIRQLVENGIRFCNSSDEVLEAVGATSVEEPVLGILISSKSRMRDLGYRLQPVSGLTPFDAVFTPNCIMLVGGAPNVNTAKLFIRWILGEADGHGIGYQPFLQKGTWSVREGVLSDGEIPLSSLSLLYMDNDYIHATTAEMRAFWESLLPL